MSVSAIIVTRGDVDMQPVLDSLPPEWEKIVWVNGQRIDIEFNCDSNPRQIVGIPDLSVYGRYAAIEYASHDLIYVQDDDVIVSNPQAIADAWEEESSAAVPNPAFRYRDHLVANMPQEFRHDGYTDSCLVGFGACFHRDAPRRAFERFAARELDDYRPLVNEAGLEAVALFNRTCDVVFTTLTPRVLVDVPKTNQPWAEDYSRMYRQPNHTTERMQMLELARKVRDA